MEQIVFKLILLLHVGGAIIGFGPTYTFGILAGLAGRAGPAGVHYLEAVDAIEKRLVIPFAILQPITGTILIFIAGFAQDFFSHYWLMAGIVLYAIAFYIAIFRSKPNVERMIAIAKAGPPTPEFMAIAGRQRRLGPLTGIILTVIIILMVTKPGP